jgi:hypothetical protein
MWLNAVPRYTYIYIYMYLNMYFLSFSSCSIFIVLAQMVALIETAPSEGQSLAESEGVRRITEMKIRQK